MAVLPGVYSLISGLYKYDFVKRAKSHLRPLKHVLFGKSGIYAAVEHAKTLSAQKGKELTSVLDVGAAVGDSAELFLKEFPSAKIYCFEPLPDSFARLTKRAARLKNGGHASLFNYALGNVNDKIKFYVAPYRDSSSVIPPERSGVSGEKIISVTLRRLDDVVRELGVTHVDFMKIDVEGFEKEMLEGAKEALKITDHVFVEISPLRKGAHNRDYIDVFEILHGAGFSLAGIYGDFFFTKLL